MSQPLILLCAGGTGGHMFPARALAEELLARGYRVAFASDLRGEKFFAGTQGAELHLISSGTPKGGIKGKISFLLPLAKGYLQSHKLISKLKPALVIGFGGYPSVPPVMAAQHRGLPTFLHEANAVLGLGNIIVAGRAKKIALSHARTKMKAVWQAKTVLTGNPIRNDISALRDLPYPQMGPETGHEINLLIFAGSLGAKSFSDIIPAALVGLPENLKNRLRVAQQVREEDLARVSEFYAKAEFANIELRPFFSDIPERLKNCHLLIVRSGGTVAELTAAGRPAIYIPYPWHKDQQQLHNAQAVTEAGGGWLLEEKNLSAESLSQLLRQILKDPLALVEAAQAARSLGQPDAAKLLADLVVVTIKN